MNKQQTIYALSSQGFFKTTRMSNHPSIIFANQRNVHLNYTKCHQIYKGQSQFKDPKAQEFYRASRSLPTKSQMFKSQITSATTDVNEQSGINLNDSKMSARMKAAQRRLVSRSFHSGNSTYKTQLKQQKNNLKIQNQQPKFEYEQTKKLEFPKNITQFETFKSEIFVKSSNQDTNTKKTSKTINSLYDCAKNLQSSYHLEQSRFSQGTRDHQTNLIQQKDQNKRRKQIFNPQSPLKVDQKLNSSQNINNDSTFTFRLNKVVQTRYIIQQTEFEQKLNSSTNSQKLQQSQYKYDERQQINKLRFQLAKKQRQLRQTKIQLQNSDKKNKALQMHVKKLQTANQNSSSLKQPLKIYTNYSPYKNYNNIQQKNTNQLSQQLGGPLNAFLYFTLFVVLLSKQMVQN